jgi:uncharacterized DUF497 family protein
MADIFESDLEFNWDQGNLKKNWLKHQINQKECESVFRDPHSLLTPDYSHSYTEVRYQIIGKSDLKNVLSIIFTLRHYKIRIISARKANQKEKAFYEQKK